jgi:hypothetical protein
MAETLAKVLRTADPEHLVRSQVIGAWNGGRVAIRSDRTGTLLGPETISTLVGVVGSDEIRSSSRTAAVPAGGLG